MSAVLEIPDGWERLAPAPTSEPELASCLLLVKRTADELQVEYFELHMDDGHTARVIEVSQNTDVLSYCEWNHGTLTALGNSGIVNLSDQISWWKSRAGTYVDVSQMAREVWS